MTTIATAALLFLTLIAVVTGTQAAHAHGGVNPAYGKILHFLNQVPPGMYVREERRRYVPVAHEVTDRTRARLLRRDARMARIFGEIYERGDALKVERGNRYVE